MAAFISGDFSLTTTAVKILDAAEFDRVVVLTASNGGAKVGYSSSSVASVFLGNLNQDFKVPAGYELWGASTGTNTLAVIVTAS